MRQYVTPFISKYPKSLLYLPVPLYSVGIELTNYCNLRCKMCYSQNPKYHEKREKGFMSFETFKNIINQINTINSIEAISLNFGGESLLHPKFIDMLNYIPDSRKYKVNIHSNGMLLTPAISEAIVKKLDRITFSLDGTKEKNEEIRVGAKYDKIKNNILYLLSIRKNKPIIGVNLVTSNHSLADILEFKKEWYPLVDEVFIYPEFTEYGEIKPHEYFKENDWLELPYCNMLFSYLAILYDGKVTYCCRDISGSYAIGDIQKNSLKEIFNNPALKTIRKNFLYNVKDNSLCDNCNSWKIRFRGK